MTQLPRNESTTNIYMLIDLVVKQEGLEHILKNCNEDGRLPSPLQYQAQQDKYIGILVFILFQKMFYTAWLSIWFDLY